MLSNRWKYRPAGAKKLKVSKARIKHFQSGERSISGERIYRTKAQARAMAEKEKYISNFFNRNKEEVLSSLRVPFQGVSDAKLKKIFVQNALERLKKGVSAKRAIEGFVSTETFKSAKERLAENALEGLREDKDALANVRRIVGWHERLDPSRILYNKETHGYEYSTEKGTATFYFDNSPKGVRVVNTSD